MVLPRTAGLQLLTIIVKQRFRITVRLLTALEDQVAGGMKRDAALVVITHPGINGIGRILIVDDGRLPHLDEDEIRARCAERSARIWKRIN